MIKKRKIKIGKKEFGVVLGSDLDTEEKRKAYQKHLKEKYGKPSEIQKTEGIKLKFRWINEDWLSLFVGMFIVFLAFLGLLDWVKW